ncbi:MAG: cell wall protein, partial [Deltaproteobacteria bacterium]|nr:cell wall protein [Deltaproteobacteria bacterium]
MNLKTLRSVLVVGAAAAALAAGCGDSGSSQTQHGNAIQDVSGDDMSVNLGDGNQGGDTAKPDTTKPDTTVSDTNP